MVIQVSDSFVAGSVSGGVTRIVTAPLDVLKVRLQLQLEPLEVVFIKIIHFVINLVDQL